MEKLKLEELISEGLSTQGIATELSIGQTTVRYWLRKYGLNTQFLSKDKNLKDRLNGKQCVHCHTNLKGARSMYCNNNCKAKAHYHNPSKQVNANTNERQKKISKERKLRLISLKGGKCIHCGYNKNYSSLHFHHRDPENKTFCLDARMLSNTRWESILIESEKCDLLCSNCHIELHNPDNMIGSCEEN